MEESESEIPSALALEHSDSEEDCTPLTIAAQCGEVEGGAKSEPGKMNEVVDEMDQKEEVIEWVSEATSVVPDVSMLPRNGEHMQWWPIPSLQCTQVGEDSLGADVIGSALNNSNNPICVVDEPPRTVCMTFKANCSQDLIVALSPVPRIQNPFLEFRIGDRGNTSAVLRLKQHDEPEASVSCIPCSGGQSISYWVVHWPGHVSVGVGEEPGCGTLLVYDHRSASSNFRRLEGCTPLYFSFSCLWYPADITNIEIRVFNSVAALDIESPNEAFYVAPGCLDALGGGDKVLVEEGLIKFKEEVYRQKKRAERFGAIYSPPSLECFLPYTLLKRLSSHRGTPQGGIDILSRDERSKAEERARRFGLSLSENSPSIVDAAMELGGRHEVENERRLSRGKRFGIGDISWMARLDEVGLKARDVFADDPDRWDPRDGASIIPEKIHVFVLDKRAAKMIRWNDLRAYFLRFGPREVEWLTDWAFNIVLQDKQDAEAALQELSYALPSPPPPNEFPLVLEKEGKRFHGGGDTAVRIQKPIETTSNDDSEVLARQEEEGQYHTTTNIKDDVNEDDKADELESEMEEGSNQVLEKEANKLSSLKRDVGGMGWRLGRLLTKMHKDRYGPKGAYVRVLLRTATKDDMLEDRPEHPKQFIGPIPTRGKLPPAAAARGVKDAKEDGSTRFFFVRGSTKRRTWEEEGVNELPTTKKTKVIND